MRGSRGPAAECARILCALDPIIWNVISDYTGMQFDTHEKNVLIIWLIVARQIGHRSYSNLEAHV